MSNSTQSTPAMTIRVYTVNREGIVTRPRAAVIVPQGYEPEPHELSTAFPPCACHIHRQAGPR